MYWLHVWNPDLSYKRSLHEGTSAYHVDNSEEGTYAYSIPKDRWYVYLPDENGELTWEYPETVPPELLAQLLLFKP